MRRDTLEIASHFMNLRKFDKAIKVLESRAEIYENNFDYYLLFGTACLYAGDVGGASSFFQKARAIKLTNTNLLLGQAALFLRRGDTDRAINYYFDILDNDPTNKTALSAMEFIRSHGDFNTICKWVDTGKIERFYPQIGINPYKILSFILPGAACFLGCILVLFAFPLNSSIVSSSSRVDLSELILSVDERKNAQETDLSSGSFAYILTSAQISDSYEKAINFFQQYHDNLAQVEINRILNSNASVGIKQKARLLMNYIEIPSFDTLKDNIDYKDVVDNSLLYLDCWVVWSGRVSNVFTSDNFYSCDFLIGYDSMEKVEGIVPVRFSVPPLIEVDKPVKVLAKISTDNGKLCLLGRAVYQSVKKI